MNGQSQVVCTKQRGDMFMPPGKVFKACTARAAVNENVCKDSTQLSTCKACNCTSFDF